MSFWVYRSNRVERLADQLGHVLAAPLTDPFAPECIGVQGPGMERWLSQRLAASLGIWANPWFPFPQAVVELVLDVALGPRPEGTARFDPRHLPFALAKALPEQLGDPAFAEAARYLAHDQHGDRLLALSTQLARVFDRYLVYRPELLLNWERGQSQEMQAKLWRAVTRGETNVHLAQRLLAFEETMQHANERALDALPPRISLFGLSSIPPAFLRVLGHAAQRIDVHLFLLAPTRAYVGELTRKERHGDDVTGLLANLGKVHRELVDLLEEQPYRELDCDLFEIPEGPSALHGLQADLAELVTRGPAPLAPPRALAPDDASIRVHACHSPMRELEVLRDEITARLSEDPSLEPHQIVVLAPDIERYAPAIEAVFADLESRGGLPLPFHVADRKAVQGAPVPASFNALLSLLRSRLGLSQVLDLMQRAPIRARFGLSEDELARATGWLADAGARWAVDGEHRSEFAQPAYAEFSLRFALDRLLLGYACPQDADGPALGLLPHAAVEGRDAEILGRVCRFFEPLFAKVSALKAPRSLAHWAADLGALLSDMISADEPFTLEHRSLSTLLSELGSASAEVSMDAPLSLSVVQDLIESELSRRGMGEALLTRGVAFCEHVPMRAIPFRVVCLLGMDDESFPRRSQRTAFDLMASSPRRGDRTPRDDDRQLFLETLLSARDAWLVTYVGRSAKDDSPRPRASVVDHVLRVLDQYFTQTSATGTLQLDFEPTASLLTREHALHSFDARYFQARSGAPFFSYDLSAFRAAQAQAGRETQKPVPFVSRALPAPERSEELELAELLRFFRHPQRRFLQSRLSLYLPFELSPLEDREPTQLDALARYRLADDLLGPVGERAPTDQQRTLAQQGKLPPGSPGRVQWRSLAETMQSVRELGDVGAPLADRRIDLACAGVRLRGRLDGLFEHARVERIAAVPATKHQLGAWICHLLLCASGDGPQRSLLVGRQGANVVRCELAPVRDPHALLADLLLVYALGQRTPLPYFHGLAEAYVKKHDGSENGHAAQAAARRLALAQPSGAGPKPELTDPYVRQCFVPEDLLTPDRLEARADDVRLGFGDIALKVLGPMLDHLEVSKA